MTLTPTPALDLDALEADGYRRLADWRLALHDCSDLLVIIERARQAEKLDLVMEAFERAIESLGNQDDQIASLRTQLAEAIARADKAEMKRNDYRVWLQDASEKHYEAYAKLVAQSALIEKAVEALGPIVRAIDACEAADGNLPDEMAALRASFDYFVRHCGEDNDEIVERDSVRVSDLRKCRAVSAALTAAIGKGEWT